MSLQGKTALVTGSTSGIGLGIALSLAKAGANVVLNGFGDATAAISEVAKHGGKVGHHPADVSSPEQIAEMITFAERDFGGIDILVNNAGIQHVAPVEEFPVERWDSIIAINLSSVFHATRLALPGMRSRGWGRIVNIASVHGLVGSVNKAAYVAAKHGVIGLTKVVALETATTNITCNALCPGWVLTPLVQQQIDQRALAYGDCRDAGGRATQDAKADDQDRARRELLAEKQPSLEFVSPDQLGELVLFLSSDAASQVRGAAWNVDGGWLAQ